MTFLALLIIVIVIYVIMMFVCLFHITEYVIYRIIWGNKVLPVVEIV